MTHIHQTAMKNGAAKGRVRPVSTDIGLQLLASQIGWFVAMNIAFNEYFKAKK